MDESWFFSQTGKFRGLACVSRGRPETVLSATFPLTYFTTDLSSLMMQCGHIPHPAPILPFELEHHSKGHSQQLKMTTREIYLPTPSPPLPSHPPLNKPLLKGIFIPYPASPTVCCITLITSYETSMWNNLVKLLSLTHHHLSEFLLSGYFSTLCCSFTSIMI